jgi:hypothetical protein
MTGTFDDPTLRRRAAKLSGLLAATDGRAPAAVFPAERIARASRRVVLVRRLRIAAAATLLLAGFGVPPVRAWIVGSVRTIWTRVMGPKPLALVPAPAPQPLAAATMGTVTVGASADFTLDVATRQADGDLTILVTDGASVSAAVNGRSDAAELTVSPDGIRIGNARTTATSYELRVPLAVSRLVVQVGRESPRVFRPTSAGERWLVSLRAH